MPAWVQALLASSGGWGLLVIAFLDSSFLPLPIINDILVITFSFKTPSLWIFYGSMATIGSILGCLVIYYLGRKGGELALRKTAKHVRIDRIHSWMERNEFLAVAIPAVMPPPTPFKIFVMAAGVFQVRLRYFLSALAFGRGLRYLLWGFLGAYYGQQSLDYLRDNFLQISLFAVALILVGYVLARLAQRKWGGDDPSPAG